MKDSVFLAVSIMANILYSHGNSICRGERVRKLGRAAQCTTLRRTVKFVHEIIVLICKIFMLDVYFAEKDGVYEKLNKILSTYLSTPFKILKTAEGKPFIEGDPLFFSISHSDEKAVIVICDKPVGIDIEVLRQRKYSSIISRFSDEEIFEITDYKQFLKHWVVREAYIKMLGSTVAAKLNNLKYVGGTLYDGDKPADCEIQYEYNENCVICICIDKKSIV